MRQILLSILILCLGISSAYARDGAVRLKWSDPVPDGAQAVVTMRSATGEIALSIRADLPEGAVTQRMDLPPPPRTAQTIQAGIVQDGRTILQGMVMPVAGNVGLEIAKPLAPTLAIGFSDVWDCGEPRPYLVMFDDTGLELIRAHERVRFEAGAEVTGPEASERFTGADGSVLEFIANRALLTSPDGTEQECDAGLFPPLLPLNATATDRSWSFSLTRSEALIDLPGIDTQTLATQGVRISAPRDGAITVQGDAIRLRLTQERCRLQDADLIYPIAAQLSGRDADATPDGCAGNPLDLLGGGAWQVTALLGLSLDRDTLRDMTLELSGEAISGRGTCNRYVGTARIESAALAFRELGTTRLGCPADLRNIELRFLDALEAATGFDISPAGVLTLRAGAQTILTARRRAAP